MTESCYDPKNSQGRSGEGIAINSDSSICRDGKKRLEELVATQTELLDKLQEANRSWFDRMQSEATLASEFANKLTTTHSIPEAATVCQEWASRHMEMAAEDAKRLFADSQKFAETGARLWSNGWLANGWGIST
jgi:Phasin protein